MCLVEDTAKSESGYPSDTTADNLSVYNPDSPAPADNWNTDPKLGSIYSFLEDLGANTDNINLDDFKL